MRLHVERGSGEYLGRVYCGLGFLITEVAAHGVTVIDKKKVGNTAKFVFLALYFLILTVERIISIITCFRGDLSRHDSLDYYMIALTILGTFAAYIFGAVKFTDALKDGGRRENLFPNLAVVAGLLLLGGMVHTEGSIPAMQFTSYAMILISMAIHTAMSVKKHGEPLIRWLSFAYIVAFSMAIPVVYHTQIELANVFIPIEMIVSAGMVIMFTGMLRRFYKENGDCGFFPGWFAFALIGDAAVLALRWQEEINFFVLIFISVTAMLWVIGTLVKRKRK